LGRHLDRESTNPFIRKELPPPPRKDMLQLYLISRYPYASAQDRFLPSFQTWASDLLGTHDLDGGTPMDWLLVVEHNRLFREGLALLLEWRTGLSSIYAGSLAEAKGVLDEATQKPACIIVDLDLPGGGGRELLEDLDGVPVVALVKDCSLQRQSEAMGLRAEEVLRTGSVEKITAVVERLIGPRSTTVF
jgi:CheY-like chemotaxis protein